MSFFGLFIDFKNIHHLARQLNKFSSIGEVVSSAGEIDMFGRGNHFFLVSSLKRTTLCVQEFFCGNVEKQRYFVGEPKLLYFQFASRSCKKMKSVGGNVSKIYFIFIFIYSTSIVHSFFFFKTKKKKIRFGVSL